MDLNQSIEALKLTSERAAQKMGPCADDDSVTKQDPEYVTSSSEDIKSTAVVKYNAVEPPATYMQLSSNTDLNLPPSNWLRGTSKIQGKWGEWVYRSAHDKIFSSFHLANNFTECVGKVDVISDAENIKKLLKIPYGKCHISMMVHRVGKTLLLDEFDIHSHLLRASPKQFEWLKKFYYEHVLQPEEEVEHPMLRKKKTRGYLQNKNMFSKFLYYSLPDGDEVRKGNDEVTKPPQEEKKKDVSKGRENPLLPTHPELKEAEEQIEQDSHEFLRNVLWTFEDIRMLIGSDLPIFGGGTYPAVSLKLRDMQKPINVLTGLDYWLDNLMCNVPEVVMCYHLNGIVQKYELIKTEDIPHLKYSQFSPKVVKDIAQNILSFLKSNATKSGHTYWLFKGKNDDVVKLYDLTTLCADIMGENEQNPFTLPVAMLLYRVACNMKESPEGVRKQGTIYKLLKNCLCLLDSIQYPQIVTSVHYLLSEVYVPSGLDPTFVHGSCPSDESDSEDEKNGYDDQENEEEIGNDSCSITVTQSPCVSVKALCIPTTYAGGAYNNTDRTIPPLSKNWEERCFAALGHIVEGLKCILKCEEKDRDTPENSEKAGVADNMKTEEEKVKVAKPFEPIPLHYSPINSPEKFHASDSDNPESSDGEKESSLPPGAEKSWKLCCKILLLQKAAQTYCALAEVANSTKRCGVALRFIKLGLLCYEHAPKLVLSHCKKWPTEPLAYLLSLAGDVLFMIHHKDFGNNDEIHEKDFVSLEKLDSDMISILEKYFGKLDNLDYSWVWTWPVDLESSLNQSSRCYETSLKVWPQNLTEGCQKLQRHWGNICNELGVFYMNQAMKLLQENGKINEAIITLWDKSFRNLETGITTFNSVGDVANVALLNSNLGRLMRLCAHAWAPYDGENKRKEFSSQERHYYNKAINYYNKAAAALGNSEDFAEVRDSVNWELSTTLFSMASMLQDYAPLSSYAQEEVEKEVSELMRKALELCEVEHPVQRIPLYQFRAASIHHKLGSLYHNAFRNQISDDHRKKQVRLLADLHYSKSCKLFCTLEHTNEFFTVIMERIGLWEHYLSGLIGFSSKLRVFYTIMGHMISSKPVLQNVLKAIESKKQERTKNKARLETVEHYRNDNLASQFDDEDERADRLKLLNLFSQRLQLAVVGLAKLFSYKASKYGKELKQWNAVLSVVIESPSEASVESYLCKLLEQLETLVPKNK